jgi:hypothetical protein
LFDYREAYPLGDDGTRLNSEGWSTDRNEKGVGLSVLFARNLMFWSSAAASTALIYVAMTTFL